MLKLLLITVIFLIHILNLEERKQPPFKLHSTKLTHKYTHLRVSKAQNQDNNIYQNIITHHITTENLKLSKNNFYSAKPPKITYIIDLFY